MFKSVNGLRVVFLGGGVNDIGIVFTEYPNPDFHQFVLHIFNTVNVTRCTKNETNNENITSITT